MPHSPSRHTHSHLLVLGLVLALFAGPWSATAAGAAAYLRPGHHRPPAMAQPSKNGVDVSFDFPRAELPQQPGTASLAVPGRNGAYLVPYIQTQPELHYRVRVQHLPPHSMVLVTLDPDQPGMQVQQVSAPTYDGTFTVEKGEHTLLAQVYSQPAGKPKRDARYSEVASATLGHVARGDIVAALGDSTTEGNGGPVFHFLPNWTSALASAADWTSPDGRNFPQAGAVAHPRALASFTSTLGTLLEQQRGHPVLVLNDGWSGATADAYSHIADSGDLAAEYGAARPNFWLINLGVNDPLTHQTTGNFSDSMTHIVDTLATRFGAQGSQVLVACPTYAKDSRHDGEIGYLPVVNQLRAAHGLGAGPDFFNFFKAHPETVADEVHPNAAGYRAMAVLWAQAIAGQGASCSS